jgi:hypothetical protein
MSAIGRPRSGEPSTGKWAPVGFPGLANEISSSHPSFALQGGESGHIYGCVTCMVSGEALLGKVISAVLAYHRPSMDLPKIGG